MKYFIDGIEETQWSKNITAYWQYFETIKKRLPADLASVLSSRELHDSEIISVNFLKSTTQQSRAYDLIISIRNEIFSGDIIHKNVFLYQNTYQDNHQQPYVCEYVYGEVSFENGCWFHNVRYEPDSELLIGCKTIEWRAE